MSPRTIRRLLLAAGVLALAAWLAFLRPSFLGGPMSYIVVSGVSMEPTLRTGDLALVYQQDDYAFGDVIAYRVERGIVIQRVIGGSGDEGYLAHGDNKTADDPWRPKRADVLGRMVLHVPGAGNALTFLRESAHLGFVVGALGVLTVIGRRRMRRRGRADR